jgi:glutathione S-transferase
VLIVGRSSSHFTRLVRMFAEESSVVYEFRVVPNLLSSEPEAYGGSPALRMPNIVTPEGSVFGSMNCCRALDQARQQPMRMVWPEHTPHPVAANALELTLQGMASEVGLIMLLATGDGSAYANKLSNALDGVLDWLDANLDEALASLPERDLSYLELSLFCFLDHLLFRGLKALDGYGRLNAFRDQFSGRASALATPFEFDA